MLIAALAAICTLSQYVPKQSDRPAVLTAEEPGFTSIFDGRTLTGWEGDLTYWKVADGIMTGEITPETVIKSNTFIVCRQCGPMRDFELKVEYRITAAGNSGINYRSSIVPDKVTPTNRFAMRGYQCDIDGRNQYTGNNYEEKGRLFLGVRGQMTRVTGTAVPSILATFADPASAIVQEDWNRVHIIARGNVVTHIVNGKVMTVVVDDDPNRQQEGLLGVQVHVGPPMKVEYRNWRLKRF